MDERVKNTIKSVYPLSVNALGKINELLNFVDVSKDDVFIRKDYSESREYFLLSGICKSYLVNPEGLEITISFFKEESILSPNSIRTVKGISILNFKALTECKLAWMDAGLFEQLMVEDLEVRAFANAVLQNELMLKIGKEIELASLSAGERLTSFRQKYKNLENLIPHTDIASYLGITNVSLSRLRKDPRG